MDTNLKSTPLLRRPGDRGRYSGKHWTMTETANARAGPVKRDSDRHRLAVRNANADLIRDIL